MRGIQIRLLDKVGTNDVGYSDKIAVKSTKVGTQLTLYINMR
jgi:hypothetical protein